MFKIKKIFILCIVLLGVLFFSSPILAQDSVDMHFFWGDGCPHCDKEKIFLDDIEASYGDLITINHYEVWHNQENQTFLQELAREGNVQVTGVPAIFIGDEVVIGFGSVDTTGVEIKRIIDDALAHLGSEEKENSTEKETVSVPFFGTIDSTTYSLPVLTFVIAAIDGFNPCAMWILVLLIGMLIGMQDRRRLWILGTVFIFVSGLVYFVFLAAWFNLFQIIGAVRFVQVLVGLFAVGASVYYFRRYWTTRPGECKVTNQDQKRKITDRMKDVISKKSLFLSLLGITVLAVLVNIVELACSAGLPAIYTQVLSLSDLAPWQYYGYLAFYILIFMLDDMIIFAIAVTTFKSIGSSGKYSHIATLVGGAVILLLGLALLFSPGLIMF